MFTNPAHLAGTRNLGLATLLLSEEPAAVAWSPAALFSGWSEDGSYITVPIASLYGLTADKADALTGDARQIITSLMASMFTWYNELSSKPGALEVVLRRQRIQTGGDYSGKNLITYEVSAYLDYPSGLVADEAE